ncbi:hypothetical protein ACA910_001433 [Epithemia clementina (nom. ined.)]
MSGIRPTNNDSPNNDKLFPQQQQQRPQPPRLRKPRSSLQAVTAVDDYNESFAGGDQMEDGWTRSQSTQTRRSSSSSSRKSSPGFSPLGSTMAFTRESLLQHELLTTDQEKELARALQRALRLQTQLQQLQQEKQQQQQQPRQALQRQSLKSNHPPNPNNILTRRRSRKKLLSGQDQPPASLSPFALSSAKRLNRKSNVATFSSLLDVQEVKEDQDPIVMAFSSSSNGLGEFFVDEDDDDDEKEEEEGIQHMSILQLQQLKELEDRNSEFLIMDRSIRREYDPYYDHGNYYYSLDRERDDDDDDDTDDDYDDFYQTTKRPLVNERWQSCGSQEYNGSKRKARTNHKSTSTTNNARTKLQRNRKNSGFLADDDDRNAASGFDLTDAEIQRGLGVSGGKAELQSILLQGAMARDALIRNNIRLVVSIAKKWAKQQHASQSGGNNSQGNTNGLATLQSMYQGSWDRPSLDEAIQEGILGLAEAADRFDPERNWKFSTYATFWVTNFIRRCYQSASNNGLYVPEGFYQIRRKFNALSKEFYYNNNNNQQPLTAGKQALLEWAAQELEMTPKRLQFILRVTQPHSSIDAPLHHGPRAAAGKAGGSPDASGSGGGDDGGMLLADLLVDPHAVAAEDEVELSFLRQNLENALASELVPLERDVVRLRLGLDDGWARTVTQIVQEYGGALSPHEVRLAESRAYKKLRSPQSLSTYKLLAYLDFAGIDRADALLR